MQRIYTTNDMIAESGYSKLTINLWASRGWLKPCRFSGESQRHYQFYTTAEHDRLMDAVRECGSHSRSIPMFLNRTLHTARDCTALRAHELKARCGCCYDTLRKAMARLGYPEGQSIVALEEDVAEVKAMVERVRLEGFRSSAEKRSAARNKPESAGTKPESAGNITLHIKGLTISLDRKDAEALAEEIIAQI